MKKIKWQLLNRRYIVPQSQTKTLHSYQLHCVSNWRFAMVPVLQTLLLTGGILTPSLSKNRADA